MVKKLARMKSFNAAGLRDLRGCFAACLVVDGRREWAQPPPPRREEKAIRKRWLQTDDDGGSGDRSQGRRLSSVDLSIPCYVTRTVK